MQILQKLTTLPFQACQHRVSSLDAQPSVGGGILVFVTGQLLVSWGILHASQSIEEGVNE